MIVLQRLTPLRGLDELPKPKFDPTRRLTDLQVRLLYIGMARINT